MKNNIGKVQMIIAIVAVLYVVMPDLFIGPIDDATLAAIAVISEIVLGIIKAVSNPEENCFPEDEVEYFR
ncbi:MAG: hypothetical protein K5665_08410 [Saccharofermentans sp.]|nr:hypothetical protein [Saccharofermentans sp.]